jgi:S1-C subfamily serine protease
MGVRVSCFSAASTIWRRLTAALLLAVLVLAAPPAAADLDESLRAVVKVRAYVAGEARSARTLGTVREGTGVVIDGDGLIVTIGYVILEAQGVEIVDAQGKAMRGQIVGYDGETGFGLVRATEPLAIKPAPMGRAARLAEGQRMVSAAHGDGGPAAAQPAILVQRREFAGYWEYLLDQALFVSPPHGNWGGAGLFTQEGQLVGVGSLFVGEVAPGLAVPGNMVVPIDLLRPVLGDLLALGTISSPGRPWMGINGREADSGIVLTRIQPESPAEKAGLAVGDVVVGVAGEPVRSLADLYRKVWSKGEPGVDVRLDVRRGGSVGPITVKTADRRRYQRTRSY